MEALQADIARRIKKRSRADSDSENSTNHLDNVKKRARHAYKPRPSVSLSQIPPILGPNTHVTSSTTSSSTLVQDDDSQTSSPYPLGSLSTDTSSDTESLAPSTESPSESTSDEISSGQESSNIFPTASSLSTESDLEPHSDESFDYVSASDSEHQEVKSTLMNIPYPKTGESLSIHLFNGSVRVERAPLRSNHSSHNITSANTNNRDASHSRPNIATESSDSESNASSSLKDDSDSDNDADSDVDIPSESPTPKPIRKPIHQGSRSKSQSRLTMRQSSSKKRNPSQLKARLDALLPQMRAANEELEVEKREGRLGKRNIENLEDREKAHIEMDLGLGVLEEKETEKKRDYGITAQTQSDDSDTDESAKEPILPALLPRGRIKRNVGIEIVEDEI